MPNKALSREIEIRDYEAGKYFEFLEGFFSSDALDEKLQKLEREVSQEQGAYLRYWVIPKSAFWLGIKEGRRFLKEKMPFARALAGTNMELPVEFAAKFMKLTDSMPKQRIDDFKQRILGADSVFPILFEIDIASHFWQIGYEIEWSQHAQTSGIKVPEFTAVSSENAVEVECKAKTPDAGRRVRKKSFYRLVDTIVEPLSSKGFNGLIEITVPDKLPIDKNIQDQITDAIFSNLQNSVIALAGGIQISLELKGPGKVLASVSEVESKIQAIRKPHSHLAAFGFMDQSTLTNPIILCVNSESNDRFLTDIFESLREANHQFSQKRPSLICCFVPEIKDFKGLADASALKDMTALFFDKHAKECVFAVSYISDAINDEIGIYISKSMPSITFYNPKYNKALGNMASIYSAGA